MNSGPQIRVGVGGWVYAPWRGVFYPPGLPQARELGYASRQLTTIEINGTFYGPQKPASFRRWHDETPEDFVFSLKGPRIATHRSDLAGAGPVFERFVASGIVELRDKLGPILWQFPPNMSIDSESGTCARNTDAAPAGARRAGSPTPAPRATAAPARPLPDGACGHTGADGYSPRPRRRWAPAPPVAGAARFCRA